jgi:glycosyltransferase involved in cell wall biosynthesis
LATLKAADILRPAHLTPPGERTVAVLPAYNAARTLERTLRDFPVGRVDEIVLVDDCSRDETSKLAEEIGIRVVRHGQNKGYGGNQKTCYRTALDLGADFIVMIHPDYQYDSRVLALACDFMKLGICDVVLGSRIRTRKEALAGGMPLIKYLANRGLTIIENVWLGQNMGDAHTGFRAYRRQVLETIPFERNSDDFVFDSQFLVQCVNWNFRLGDIPVPVRYFDEASSINLRRSSIYALQTLWTLMEYTLHNVGLLRYDLFRDRDPVPVPTANPASA